MDQNGFKSKYTAQQIEHKLDQLSTFDCGVFRLPSSDETPVNLDTIYDDFEIKTGLYVTDYIDEDTLPTDLQGKCIVSYVIHLFYMDNMMYQLLIAGGSMYIRHYVTTQTSASITGTWTAWEKLITGGLTAESIQAALGYKPADADDVIALEQAIAQIRDDLEKLRKNSENNFNAIKLKVKTHFKLSDWFVNDVTILRITIITYSQVSLNTNITITNIVNEEIINVPTMIPRSSYIYDLYEEVSNLRIDIENAKCTKADMIIEYMGPQDGKYGGLIRDPNTGKPIPGTDPDDPCKPPKPGEDSIICKASSYDPYLKNHITLPPSNEAIAFRRNM